MYLALTNLKLNLVLVILLVISANVRVIVKGNLIGTFFCDFQAQWELFDIKAHFLNKVSNRKGFLLPSVVLIGHSSVLPSQCCKHEIPFLKD